MNVEDRACFNCEASSCSNIPPDTSHDDMLPWGIINCRQKLSDHYKHYVELTHVCAWHSDDLQHDTRYPLWRDSIDLPER